MLIHLNNHICHLDLLVKILLPVVICLISYKSGF